MRFDQAAEDERHLLAELRCDLPDDLAEFAEQLDADADYLALRYPAQSPAVWWDRAREGSSAEAATAETGAAEVRPGEASSPRRVRSVWYRQPAAASAALVLLLLACGWLLSRHDENQRPPAQGRDAGLPVVPSLAGVGGLAVPGTAMGDASPASWTPEAYPDVSGEEEQVLHDELKQIRAADL